MIVNKYNQGGGGSGSGVTPQDVQRQIDSALTPYWDSAATESAITQSVSGKADAANIEANQSSLKFATWNNQGIVQGTIGSEVYNRELKINGDAKSYFTSTQYFGNLNFYAPETSGNAGDILVSVGNGAPVWSAVTIPDMTAYTPTSGFSTINGSAITNGGNIVIQGGGDMSGYYTSAQTDEKIASAVTPVANHLAEVEQITASAYTELHDDILALSARTPDMSAYTPTSGFSTINGSAITNGGNIVIQGGGGDMSNYWNSAETKSYVDSAATNLQDQIDTMDEVVADALNDLNGDVAAVSGMVSDLTSGQQPVVRTMLDLSVPSTPITRIISLPQYSYDSLESQGLISPNTFYIIVSSN